MLEFLEKYFSFDAILARIIWMLVMSAVSRLVLWLFRIIPRRGELWYWAVAFLVFLSIPGFSQYSYLSFAPKLDLRVSLVTANIAPMPHESTSTSMFLEVVVLNAGAPSIADRWEVSIQMSDGKPINATMIVIPETVHLEGGTGKITYYGQDALYKRTVDSPIPSGGRVAGILWCKIENVSSDIVDRPGTRVILKYVDVRGQQHVASESLSGVQSVPIYLPGLRLPEDFGQKN